MNAEQESSTPWRVDYTSSVKKQIEKLLPNIRDIFYILERDLKQEGPEQPECEIKFVGPHGSVNYSRF